MEADPAEAVAAAELVEEGLGDDEAVGAQEAAGDEDRGVGLPGGEDLAQAELEEFGVADLQVGDEGLRALGEAGTFADWAT